MFVLQYDSIVWWFQFFNVSNMDGYLDNPAQNHPKIVCSHISTLMWIPKVLCHMVPPFELPCPSNPGHPGASTIELRSSPKIASLPPKWSFSFMLCQTHTHLQSSTNWQVTTNYNGDSNDTLGREQGLGTPIWTQETCELKARPMGLSRRLMSATW